jgi:hypothetical protein
VGQAVRETDKLSGIKVALREADWLSVRNAAPMETQTSCQGIKLAKLDVWEADKTGRQDSYNLRGITLWH